LIDKSDFASGTSSRSSKLIHGGLRYLEHLEFSLVREALRERATLTRLAPHLSEPLAFLVPLYEAGIPSPLGNSRLKLSVGLWLYDLLAGAENIGRHRWVNREEALRLAPRLQSNGLRGGFVYYDCLTNDSRLVIEVIKAAARRGGAIANYAAARALMKEGPRVSGIDLEDRLTGETVNLRAKVVVNAAGPYAREVGRMAGIEIPVDPFRRHIFIAQAPAQDARRRAAGEAAIDPAWPDGWNVPASRIMVIDFETTFYFHREGSGLLFGMGDPNEAPTFDTTVRWDFLEELTPIAVRRLPALADASISHAWAGLYEMTPDGNPIVGPAPGVSGFFLVNGFSGHGFQHSPAAGRILADLIAGRDAGMDLTPFAAERFGASTVDGERCVV